MDSGSKKSRLLGVPKDSGNKFICYICNTHIGNEYKQQEYFGKDSVLKEFGWMYSNTDEIRM